MATYVWPYVTAEEYRCRCCGQLPPAYGCDSCVDTLRTFFDDFKAVREAWGRPINISCGYRCPAQNAAVGGEPMSAHLFGLALDCDFEFAGTVLDFAKKVEEVAPHLRMGTYTTGGKSFVHLDGAYLIHPRASLAWRRGARWEG